MIKTWIYHTSFHYSRNLLIRYFCEIHVTTHRNYSLFMYKFKWKVPTIWNLMFITDYLKLLISNLNCLTLTLHWNLIQFTNYSKLFISNLNCLTLTLPALSTIWNLMFIVADLFLFRGLATSHFSRGRSSAHEYIDFCKVF